MKKNWGDGRNKSRQVNSGRVSTIVKGMIIGATMMVPGASGGTMAIIMGVYDQLIRSVSGFMKHKRESFIFLLLFSAGGCVGMFLLSGPVLFFMENYNMPTMYFFIGIVAGGIPLIVRKSEASLISWKRLLHMSIGVMLVLLISVLPSGCFDTDLNTGAVSAIMLAAAGFIAAVALILPGISVSYLLLVLGLYNETMTAVSNLYMPFLMPLGAGMTAGVLITARCLERAMDRYPLATYSIILGFVIGSMAEVFPGFPDRSEIIVCMAAAVVGFMAVMSAARVIEH
ncbi:MAG: DUF368 domain-containing protein [Lentihominibacter sp.]